MGEYSESMDEARERTAAAERHGTEWTVTETLASAQVYATLALAAAVYDLSISVGAGLVA